MTITSALIAECRREYGDEPKSTSVSRQGNGSVNIFNAGKFPVLEGSYTVYISGIAKTEVTHYTYDLDNGDIAPVTTPGNGIEVRSDHKYAFWRDKNWNEAIGNAIEDLNARGFFRQVVRNTSIMRISANVQSYSGPSACVDLYEFLVSDNYSVSGNFVKPYLNLSYQSDANKLVLGSKPTVANRVAISYLRRLQKYSATSATLDVQPEWEVLVKKKAGANFFRALAGKIAKEGNASIDEGHFSFTNLRQMANDLEGEYKDLALRKKPARPAKDLQWNLPESGTA